MKLRNLTMASIAMLAICLSFTACKKNTTSSTSVNDSTQTQTDDQVMVSNETDDANNDATAAFEGSGTTYAERPDISAPGIGLPCDATVTVDTLSTPRTITIVYNGSNCSGTRTRTGKITLSFPSGFRWKNAGSTLIVTFDSFKVVRALDHKSIMISGADTITNTSGGLLVNLGTLGTITHTIHAHYAITFGNDSTATWNINKTRVFTYNNGIVLTTNGSVSGINRFGNQFTTTITQPIVIAQSCDFRVVSGQLTYVAPIGTITATYGLDVHGDPVTSCPLLFYYKLQLTTNTATYTYIAPYF
jgi:hypothetical protein